ncbi:threonine dehydratase [Tistlia consotensis]|uniref:Threonine dehydratase n=1 Tax=Tistlia consotensis USBA 355 TaxID=560819 RepID=A0A1Y6C9J3_9PROT|nr:threonine ammonia-lyase [Tistlia consotensis]SMF43680.1 threonine dehydratase [Tistlia consotensis USBA 355]SNR42820.1 threonine dehydratase [Tistlia consotensis]
MTQTVTIDDIRRAAGEIAGQVVRTPTVEARRLGELIGCELWLKLENLQFTGSFKDRGSLVKLLSLTAAERKRGVIAMSAGNHAQGVAYHAGRLGIPATIVMPVFAPFTKVSRTRALGAKVVLAGDTLDASAEAGREIAAREGLVWVHPYDDPLIVAGQGTIGLELMEDRPELDCVVVPIGGGGLIGGIATAVKAIRPETEMVGVEAELFPSMKQVLRGEQPRAGGTTLADGIAVKTPGRITREIVRALVADILLVSETELEAAVSALVELQKVVAEGAGAAGVAALLAQPERFRGRRVATVICGGNIDVRLLSGVLNRALVRDGRLVRLRVSIIDQPGQLAKLAQVIGETGGNIVEVVHQRLFADVPAKQADIDVIVETRNQEHVQEIIQGLKQGGFASRVLSTRSIDGGA